MNFTLNEKTKKTLSFLILPFSFSILFSFFFLQNQVKTVFWLWENLKQGQNLEKRLTQKVETLEKLKNQLAENKEKVDLLEKQVPYDRDLPAFLEGLNKLSAQNYVSLAFMSSTRGIPSKSLTMPNIPLTIIVNGQKDKIVKFIKNLEEGERFLTIENIDISRLQQTETEGFYTCRIVLNIYYLGE